MEGCSVRSATAWGSGPVSSSKPAIGRWTSKTTYTRATPASAASPRWLRRNDEETEDAHGIRPLETAEHSRRKHHDAAHHAEHAVNRDADDAERKQQDPDEGIHDDRQERERPTKQQEDAPEEKLPHVLQYDSRRKSFSDCRHHCGGADFGRSDPWWQVKQVTLPNLDSPSAGRCSGKYCWSIARTISIMRRAVALRGLVSAAKFPRA